MIGIYIDYNINYRKNLLKTFNLIVVVGWVRTVAPVFYVFSRFYPYICARHQWRNWLLHVLQVLSYIHPISCKK